MIRYVWRGPFDSSQVERLHAEGFRREPVEYDWWRQVNDHSLGWVCANNADELVGFVNIAWDGLTHAFVLDTVVSSSSRRQGIGAGLVQEAVQQAKLAGCEWLHVDFEDHLRAFYFDACGFQPTPAGVIAL